MERQTTSDLPSRSMRGARDGGMKRGSDGGMEEEEGGEGVRGVS